MNQVETMALMEDAIRNGIPALYTGEPGVGKTAMMRAVADKLYGPAITQKVVLERLQKEVEVVHRPYYKAIHLAQCDPTDLPGIPFVADGKLLRSRPYWMPDDDCPEGILFLDELGQAPMAVQNSAMPLVHEGKCGDWSLPPGWGRAAATNDAHHRAGAGMLNRALLGRFHIRVDVTVDPKQFRNLASRQLDFDPEVVAFLSWKPTLCQAYEPDKKASPTCRGWEQVSDLQKRMDPSVLTYETFCGILGEGVAREFVAFKRLREKVVHPEEIIRDPNKCKVPGENHPDMIHATVGALRSHLKKADIPTLEKAVVYARRLPADFAVMLAKDLLADHKQALLMTDTMRGWLRENMEILAG